MTLNFDKIYALHLVEDKDRFVSLQSELDKTGIDANIWYTCKRGISNQVGNLIPSLKVPYYEQMSMVYPHNGVMGSVFNCAFEHYTIVKTCYLRGYEHILVMEDDIKFIDDNKLIEHAFNNTPSDYDLVQFWQTAFINDRTKTLTDENTNNLYSETKILWDTESTLCYALSRRGMERYIEIMDERFLPADNPFKYFKGLNCYRLNYIICRPNNNLKSNIVIE